MVVDVGFKVHASKGAVVPADHGYLLYGAVTQALPALHAAETAYAVHPIQGMPAPGRELELGPQSRVTLRLDHDLLPQVLPLAGRAVRIGRAAVTLGVPSMRPLLPTATLRSRLVVIKGFMDAGSFVEAVRRQLEGLGVTGVPSLLARQGERSREGHTGRDAGDPIRRTLRVHDKEIVGFAVGIDQLTADESIRLQEVGVGGRRRFGCGVFVPWRTR